MLKEARNAPSVIAKIERALAVIDDDIAAIDERLLACGADVAAAQEIQREKDKKTEKQTLYYEEWERLEAVMEEAKAHGGGA
jgi:cob(I)alamin adenosyltransferase